MLVNVYDCSVGSLGALQATTGTAVKIIYVKRTIDLNTFVTTAMISDVEYRRKKTCVSYSTCKFHVYSLHYNVMIC